VPDPRQLLHRLHAVLECSRAQRRTHRGVLAADPLAPNRQAIINNAVAVLRAQGASVRTLAVSDIPLQPGSCVEYPIPAIPAPPAVRCSSVLLYGFKRDLNAYLAATPGAPHHTLAEIVAYNSTYVPPMKYGQQIAAAAAQVNISPGSPDTLRYLSDRA